MPSPANHNFARSFLLSVVVLLLATASCRTVESTSKTSDYINSAWSSLILGQPSAVRTDYLLPTNVSLCGEPLPLNRPAVREKLEFEFLTAVNHKAQVELWLRRANRYFPLIEAELKRYGLPDDLKYLAVAESDLRPSVKSHAGAVGLWQFMPSTARQLGLTVNKEVDLRHLPEPLLRAGLTYLSRLKTKFGSWALAMAAYNAGDARISRAMSNQGTTDYYELDLVNETERYVYRIAAIKLVLEGAKSFGFNENPEPTNWRPLEFDEVNLTFTQPTSWAALAKAQGCDYKTLRLLNPHLAALSPLKGGPFTLRLPKNRNPTLGT
ncbi:MAG: lytic transglycosylase domain-containing protein [Deltaproteobacteria bacterium]|nr:lytic transglycosylase domain-containing protein [Deltaproteobacteria bacterium]